MIYGFDIDNVLSPFSDCFSLFLKIEYGIDMPDESEWDEYHVFDRVLEKHGIKYKDAYEKYIGLDGFLKQPVIPFSQNAVNTCNESHDTYIITARPNTKKSVSDTIEWLESNGFEFDNILFGDKSCIIPMMDVVIDDHPKWVTYAILWGVRAYTPDFSYNKDVPKTAVRLPSWKEGDMWKTFLKLEGFDV